MNDEEAIQKFNEQLDNVRNRKPINETLIRELEEHHSHVITPLIAKLQEEIARSAVELGILTEAEANNALAERFKGKLI